MKWIKESLLLNILLFIIAAAVAYGSFYMVKQAVALYRESAENRKKIEELTQRKRELDAYLEHLQTPGAIEQEAKERFNLKIPGEQVVVVIADKASSTQGRIQKSGQGFWQWLAAWLATLK